MGLYSLVPTQRKEDAALLGALLLKRGQLVSRRDLAEASGLSINELESRLAPYIQAGYPIAFHPQGSLSLQEPPDIWCAEEILARCPKADDSTLPAWDPLLLTETASTNDVAREHARRGAAAGFVVAASRQTAGRGRLGRSWESPPNRGLYVSILLRPEWPMADAGKLAILGSLATADAVEAVSGLHPKIKWPNDLMVGDRKLAGLLIETQFKGNRLDFAVIGIGLNVRHEVADFSPEVRERATSIYLATGHFYRRVDLLVSLLQAFERRLTQPFAEAREAWTASSLTLGQRVTLTTSRGTKHGQAIGLDESGALLLRGNSGEIETITAGDMQAC